jgi:DNA polymerase III subunit alpha
MSGGEEGLSLERDMEPDVDARPEDFGGDHRHESHTCHSGCDHQHEDMLGSVRPSASNKPFAHLHNHTHHSVTDGLQTMSEMVAAAIADGQPAISINDHGTLSGTLKLAKECEKQSKAAGTPITPILGMEAYLAFGDRRERSTIEVPADDDGAEPDAEAGDGRMKRRAYEHLTLLAENAQGWRNLITLSSQSYTDGMFHKPRIDFDLLAEHREGLIVLTGCIGGPVAGRLARGDQEGAEQWLGQAVSVLGRDNVFVEVMDHGIPAQRRVIPGLIELSRKFGLSVVATNDAHYTDPGAHDTHDAWLAVQQDGVTLSTPGRWQFQGEGHHLRTAAEMRGIFDGAPGTESACDSTLLIAERVAANGSVIPEYRLRLPRFPVPEGYADEVAYLKALVAEGARQRYGDPIPDDVKARLRYEFDVIVSKGFASYFLITADMINFARSQGIRVGAGRGSAAGCCISYCLGIVTVDPLAYGLLFERFLHPERMSMPDIDTDFEQARRPEVYHYLVDRWGVDRVAHIGTFGTVKAKAAIKDAARLLDAGIAEPKLADALSKAVPKPHAGKTVSLARALDESNPAGADLRTLRDRPDSRAADVLELAAGFEDRIRSESVHPCAVVIADTPLNEVVPVRRSKGDFVTQFDADDVEGLGLLKQDLLGLRNLDIIELTLDLIEEQTGERPDLDHLVTVEDERAARMWSMIQRGETSAVFQLESSGMQELCRRLRPRTFDDLAALIALYRPGPMSSGLHYTYADRRNDREPVTYGALATDPAEVAVLESVLGETYGCLIYQEAGMIMAQRLAGFTPGEADDLRKAMGKKIDSLMASIGSKFIDGTASEVTLPDGTVKPAYSRETGERVWNWIKAGSDYVFNKSHSYAYADTVRLTAWLKANYPVHYAAANFATQKDAERRLAIFTELRDAGIAILPPDVNESGVIASPGVDGRSIRMGLADVTGVSDVADLIVQERTDGGAYASVADLMRRCAPIRENRQVVRNGVNAGTIGHLIKAGACDRFGPRFALLQVLAADAAGIEMRPGTEDWHPIERLHHERAALGVYVSDHPLNVLKGRLASWRPPGHGDVGDSSVIVRVHQLHEQSHDAWVQTVGVINGFSRQLSKAGNPWLSFNLEGSKSTIRVLGFGKFIDYLDHAGIELFDGMVIGLRGQVTVEEVQVRKQDDDALGVEGDDEVEVRLERRLRASACWVIDDGASDFDELLRAAPVRPLNLPAISAESAPPSLAPAVSIDAPASIAEAEQVVPQSEIDPDDSRVAEDELVGADVVDPASDSASPPLPAVEPLPAVTGDDYTGWTVFVTGDGFWTNYAGQILDYTSEELEEMNYEAECTEEDRLSVYVDASKRAVIISKGQPGSRDPSELFPGGKIEMLRSAVTVV